MLIEKIYSEKSIHNTEFKRHASNKKSKDTTKEKKTKNKSSVSLFFLCDVNENGDLE